MQILGGFMLIIGFLMCKSYVEKTFEYGECFSPFKEPRSETTLYALKYGDEKIKNEVKQNLLKEFPKWKEEDIVQP